jgi:hypothetical protein
LIKEKSILHKLWIKNTGKDIIYYDNEKSYLEKFEYKRKAISEM